LLALVFGHSSLPQHSYPDANPMGAFIGQRTEQGLQETS